MRPRQARSHYPRHYFAVVGEPNEWTFRALHSLLSPNGFEVLQARSSAELVDQVKGIRPDLVLVSDAFPDLDPPEICRLLTGVSSFNPATPLLVTTSEIVDETRHLENLRAGAWDTVRLPANAEELLLRITRFVDAKAMSDLARAEGMIDRSTGFYSLRGVLHRTEEETAQAWRFRRSLSCMVFGPVLPSGSSKSEAEALKDSARLEKSLVEVFRRMGRRSDVIGRMNPTEFIVVAPATDEGMAVRMGERFLAEMQHLTTRINGQEVSVEMRAGYFSPGDPAPTTVEPEELVSKAAGALRRTQERHEAEAPITRWQEGDLLVLPLDAEAAEPTGARPAGNGTH